LIFIEPGFDGLIGGNENPSPMIALYKTWRIEHNEGEWSVAAFCLATGHAVVTSRNIVTLPLVVLVLRHKDGELLRFCNSAF
jgi:hypothetical protein